MDINDLDKLLPITGSKLTLTQTTLPGDGLKNLLIEYNATAAIVLDGAKKTVGQTDITVTGTSSFLNTANLAVTAVFTLDKSGNPQVCLTYALIGKSSQQGNWIVSQSFPDLPDFDKNASGVNYLDQLVLTNASYVLTTADMVDPLSGKPIGAGLNFSSNLAPQGIAGLFESALGTTDLVLTGPISLPQVGQTLPEVPYQEFPWNAVDPVPGIYLTTDLGINIDISSSIKITDAKLRMYTPPSQEFLEKNNSYRPVLVLSGNVDFLTLGKSVEIFTYVGAQTNTATIFGLFDNFTFDSLTKLTDIVNGDGLMDALPDDIKSEVTKIASKSQLELDQFSLTLQAGFTGSAIQAATVTVGLPGVSWNPVGDFDLSGFTVQFIVTTPFDSGRNVTAALSAVMTISGEKFNVNFQVPGFSLFAQMERGSSIDLTKLFSDNFPALPTPPDLAINDMMFNAKPNSGEYDFFMALAEGPKWTLDVTPVPITIYDVRVQINKAAQTSGEFSGNMSIGDFADLSATYTVPGGLMVRSVIPKIELSDLIKLVSNTPLDLPVGFDFSFDETFILIEENNSNMTFSVGTQVDKFGLLVLTAQKLAGKWNYGFGMEVDVNALGDIPGLSVIKDFNNFAGLDEILLVVSAADVSNFNFPDIANFNQPSLGTKNIKLPTQAGSGLVEGINLYAKVIAFKNKGLQLLAGYLDIDLNGSIGATLAISLPDPDKNSKFFLSVDFKVNGNTTLIGELGVLLQSGDIGVFLTAELDTEIQGQKAEFSVTGLVVEDGAFISGTIKDVLPKFNLTPSFAIQFSNLAVEIGIDAAEIPSFGFMGSIDTSSGFDSSIALFFDSANPAKSLIAGAVSDINLYDIVDTFSDDVATSLPGWMKDVLTSVGVKGLNAFSVDASLAKALDNLDLASISAAFSSHGVTVSTSMEQTFLVVNETGKIWSLTTIDSTNGITHYQLKLDGANIDVELEAQLYLAPETMMLGNFPFKKGFKAIGVIDFLFLEVTSDTVILPSQGVKINETIKKIDWPVAGIPVFSLTGANGKGGAELSVQTYTDNGQGDPKLKEPHFLLNGGLRFLDFESASAFVDIRKAGAEFDIKDTVFAVTLDMAGQFTSIDDMSVTGTAACEIGTIDLGAAGSISVDTGVIATLGVAVTDPEQDLTVTAMAGLEIDILGDLFKIVNEPFSVDEKFFENLILSLEKLIVDEILKAPEKWLKWVVNGLISISDSIANILKDIFSISSWQDAAKLMWDAAVGFEKIITQIVDAFAATTGEVAAFLEGLVSNCAVGAVNGLTSGLTQFKLYDVAQGALAEMGTTTDSQKLLYLYYENQSLLELGISEHPEAWVRFVGEKGDYQSLSESAVDRCIDGLSALMSQLPSEGQQPLEEAITILNNYRGKSWDQFKEISQG